MPRPPSLSDLWPRAAGALLGAALVLFVVGPLLRLLLAAAPADLAAALRDPALRGSIALTIACAALATLLALALGLPLAWTLARRRFRGRALLLGAVELPAVVPHPVAGIALLLFLGRRTPIGGALAELGLQVVGRTPGIVAAMLFVSVPILVSGARASFESVDPRLERVARSLGDTPWRAFRRVTLPLARRGIGAAALLAWARSVSEFGAIVVLAYHPPVASVLIYDRFTTEGLAGAVPAAAVLLVVALGILVAVRLLERGSTEA